MQCAAEEAGKFLGNRKIALFLPKNLHFVAMRLASLRNAKFYYYDKYSRPRAMAALTWLGAVPPM